MRRRGTRWLLGAGLALAVIFGALAGHEPVQQHSQSSHPAPVQVADPGGSGGNGI